MNKSNTNRSVMKFVSDSNIRVRLCVAVLIFINSESVATFLVACFVLSLQTNGQTICSHVSLAAKAYILASLSRSFSPNAFMCVRNICLGTHTVLILHLPRCFPSLPLFTPAT